MSSHYYEKPIYGLKAAEVWNDITGNYPILPDSSGEQGAVLLNSKNNKHIVGFFGFKDFPDQVFVFNRYFLAEEFYKSALENPHSYRLKPIRLTLEGNITQGDVLEKRPKHIYEGSGSSED